MLKSLALITLLAAPVAAQAQDRTWTVEGQVAVVSDYRDRGYTLSDGRPALQGEATLSHASGVYVGLWASTLDDYGIGPDGDGARVELTAYAGWAGSVGGLDVDLGVWANRYPDGTDVDYVEFPVQVGRTFGAATLTAGAIYAPAQTGLGDEDDRYLWIQGRYAPAAWPVELHATVGQEEGAFAPDGKTDWRLGLDALLGRVVLTLDWVDSDIDDSAVVGGLKVGF